MLKYKILTARAQGNVSDIYDRLADDLERFLASLPQFSNPKVEWHQSQHGEYDIRLTAIVSYTCHYTDAYS